MKLSDMWFKHGEMAPKVSVFELKRLLVELAVNHHRVRIRFRFVGQMWQPGFLRVIDATDGKVLLKDEHENKSVIISDLKMVMQFELDGSMHAFAPNFHYQVTIDQAVDAKQDPSSGI